MMLNLSRRRGTSMVELLVVIVIFLVGILAVIQIFPRGLQVIANTRTSSQANALARAELERLRGQTATLPDLILPVRYLWNGTNVTIEADVTRGPDDLGPYSDRLDINGNLLDASNNILGKWQYLAGANNVRRIIGEGGPVPAPRRVGADLGGLMVLNFAPAVAGGGFTPFFVVYGNDLSRRSGDPTDTGNPVRVRPFDFFVDNEEDNTAVLFLQRNPTKVTNYRVSFSCRVDDGATNLRREVIDSIVTVPVGTGWETTAFSTLHGTGTFLSVEFDSVRVQRIYDEVPVAGAFSNDPYEYKLLNPTLGLVLFNRLAYNYQVAAPQGRLVPLTARVNYDVYDWRILREDFRVSSEFPAEQKLRLSSLMHRNRGGADLRAHTGLGFSVSDDAAGTEERDFILMDLSTGGIFTKTSLKVNYSTGSVALLDVDPGTAGLQVGLMLPGATAPTVVNPVGRSVRALYMAQGEWAVQVQKAASNYAADYDIPGPARFYAGGSRAYFFGSDLRAGESYTRIYFPPMDAGKRVTIGQIWYDVAGNPEPQVLRNQDFLITNSPADAAVGLPYIDIRTVAPAAQSINYARYGVGVRGVKGASVNVRVLWNPAQFSLVADEARNLESLENWGRNYRRHNAETYLQKEEAY